MNRTPIVQPDTYLALPDAWFCCGSEAAYSPSRALRPDRDFYLLCDGLCNLVLQQHYVFDFRLESL